MFVDKIIKTYRDKNLQSMIMIDGGWGEGKTFYAKNSLMPKIEEHNYSAAYLSLVGVNDMQTFKSKLINSTLASGERSDFAREVVNGSRKVFSTFFPGGKSLDRLMSSASSIFIEYALNKIKNKFILVDDIDRVNNEPLELLILGLCSELSEQGNMIIFVANKVESSIDRNAEEKFFSSSLVFKNSYEKTASICFSNLSNYVEDGFFIRCLEKHKVSNIRIVKRVASVLNESYDKISSDEQVDVKKTLELLTDFSLEVVKLYFTEKVSKTEIISKKYYDAACNGHSRGVNFINCLTDGSNLTLNREDIPILFMSSDVIRNLVYTDVYKIPNEKFTPLVNKLYDYIFLSDKVNFKDWFEACGYYLNLIKLSAIEKDYGSSISEIENASHEKEFDFTAKSFYSINFQNEDLDDIRDIIFQKNGIGSNIHTRKEIESSILDIENKVNNFYENLQVKPIFLYFDRGEILDIVKNMSYVDLGLFIEVIEYRMTIAGNGFFSSDKKYMSEFKVDLDDYIDTLDSGFKKGVMKTLSIRTEGLINRET